MKRGDGKIVTQGLVSATRMWPVSGERGGDQILQKINRADARNASEKNEAR